MGKKATRAEAGKNQVISAPLWLAPAGVELYGLSSNPVKIPPIRAHLKKEELQPIPVGSVLQSILGSDKYALRLKLTFKALEKLKILLGSYEH